MRARDFVKRTLIGQLEDALVAKPELAIQRAKPSLVLVPVAVEVH